MRQPIISSSWACHRGFPCLCLGPKRELSRSILQSRPVVLPSGEKTNRKRFSAAASSFRSFLAVCNPIARSQPYRRWKRGIRPSGENTTTILFLALPFEAGHFLAGRRFPQPNRFVLACGGDGLPSGENATDTTFAVARCMRRISLPVTGSKSTIACSSPAFSPTATVFPSGEKTTDRK